jgi:hypothetical protein
MPRDKIEKPIRKSNKQLKVAKIDENFGAQIEGHIEEHEAQWVVLNRPYQISTRLDEYVLSPDMYHRDVSILSGNRYGFGIRCLPATYRLWPEYRNSPPREDCYDHLVYFLSKLVTEHSPQPSFIELFNEPNIGRDAAKKFEAYFGAWMLDGEDPRIGGIRYREMLAYVYPRLKSLVPNMKIHAGALMDNAFRDGFLVGMFPKGDRRKLADAISFHYYLSLGTPFESIKTKVNKIRSRTSLPIILSETSVLDENDSIELQTRQDEWLKYLIKNRSNLGIDKILWYTAFNNGWWNSDMIMSSKPKLVYTTFKGG